MKMLLHNITYCLGRGLYSIKCVDTPDGPHVLYSCGSLELLFSKEDIFVMKVIERDFYLTVVSDLPDKLAACLEKGVVER